MKKDTTDKAKEIKNIEKAIRQLETSANTFNTQAMFNSDEYKRVNREMDNLKKTLEIKYKELKELMIVDNDPD